MSIDEFGKEPPAGLEHDFERKLFRQYNSRGASFPISGPWVVGKLDREGPEYGWKLYKEYNQFLSAIGGSQITYQTITKKLYYLRFIGVLRNLSSSEALSRGLELEPEEPIPAKDTAGQIDGEREPGDEENEQRVYNEIDDVDTDFLDESSYIVPSESPTAGRLDTQIATVFPHRVENPYKVWRLYRYLQQQLEVAGETSERKLKNFVAIQQAQNENPDIPEWTVEPQKLKADEVDMAELPSFSEIAGESLETAKERVAPIGYTIE